MKLRAGSSLIELLTTFIALGLITAACGALMRSQAALLKSISEHAAADETLRAGSAVLKAEMRDVRSADVRAVGRDSIALRVFRGVGILCSISPPRLTLRYRGVRQPDPTKDSLLIAGSEQTGTILMLSSRVDPCPVQPGEQLIALEPDMPISNGAVILLYESGSYHLATSALRYRRGASGLQPITDDFIDHAASQFRMLPGGVQLDVLLRSTANATVPAQQTLARIRLAP